MKYVSKIGFAATALLTALLPVLAAVHLANAAGSGTATLYLSPASTAVGQGANFDIDVHEDSGSDLVNAVQANLSYSSNLTFISITSSAAFGINAQSTGGGGSVNIGRGATPAISGDHVIATVRFKANSAGTATVNFASGTALVRSTDNGPETLTENGGSYTITSNATMTLSPASKTISQGTSFDVAVYGDSGSDPVNAVQANLSYPADKLAFVSSTGNTSAWPVEAQNTGGNGLVQIGRGATSPLTGSNLIATVRFTATAAGTAQVAFASGTGMVRSDTNTAEPSTNTGGSFTITAVTASGGGVGTTGGKGGSGSGSTAQKPNTSTSSPPKSYTSAPSAKSTPSTTPADTTGPVISDIKLSNLTTKSATVNWTTSEPATSEVDFGLDKNYILSTSDATLATNHSLALDPKELVAHKTYHFVVKSADNAGNQSVSQDMTFSTGGIQVTTTEIAVAAGAAILGGGAWMMAAAGGLKLGGGMMAASGGGIYIEPKPIILGGGSPPPPPAPVVHPMAATSQTQIPVKDAPKAAPPAAAQSQVPGKVVGPKTPAPPQAENQTLPKWVKNK